MIKAREDAGGRRLGKIKSTNELSIVYGHMAGKYSCGLSVFWPVLSTTLKLWNKCCLLLRCDFCHLQLDILLHFYAG